MESFIHELLEEGLQDVEEVIALNILALDFDVLFTFDMIKFVVSLFSDFEEVERRQESALRL